MKEPKKNPYVLVLFQRGWSQTRVKRNNTNYYKWLENNKAIL